MIYRARRMSRLEIRSSGRTPGGIFHLHERVAGWSRTGSAHKPFPKFPVGGPAPIFWPNFLGKNFGNKNRVVSIPEKRVLRQRRSRMKLAGSGEHRVDAIAIAASRVGS